MSQNPSTPIVLQRVCPWDAMSQPVPIRPNFIYSLNNFKIETQNIRIPGLIDTLTDGFEQLTEKLTDIETELENVKIQLKNLSDHGIDNYPQ